MKLRVARHTKDLLPLIEFYHHLLGLENLGSFTDHHGYNGVFLGNQHWHLEFTTSSESPLHHSDEDDMLVFYCDDEQAYQLLLEKIKKTGIPELVAKNPYWNAHGKMFADPDGFRILITV